MRKKLLSKLMLLLCALLVGSTSAWADEKTFDFKFETIGTDGWTNSYAAHSYEYDEGTVKFTAASKQTGTITTMPVTKGQPVEFVMADGYTMSAVTFTCQKWGTKAQTITLHYSTDGGENYTSTGVNSTEFSITSNQLPSGTNAVKITFSSTSNQVGIEYAKVTYTTGGGEEASPLASISVDASKATTVFHVGDEFTHEGAVVTATYEDDSEKDVTANAIFSDPDMTTAGEKTVTVSYTENEVEKTTSYKIEVLAPATLSSITLSGTYPTEFTQGDEFSSKGIVVTANWSDNTTSDVTADATFEGYDMATSGEQTVTVSYEDKTAQYTITVNAYVQPTEFEIAFNNSLFGTNYSGSVSGITDESPASGTFNNVTVTYAGSGNHYINDSQIRFYPNNKLTFEAPTGYNITSIVFTSAGTWAATISAEEGTYTSSTKTWEGEASSVLFTGSGSSRCDMSKVEITLEANTPKVLSSIALSGDYPTTFHVGDVFSHEGMTVTANYEGGKTADVTASATFTGYDMANTGEQTVTVSYTENEVTKTAEYNITVNAPATLTSIELSGTYPTQFEQGDEFSSEGIIVTAKFDDNTTSDVTADATFSGYNMNTLGEQTVTVTYNEKTAQYAITVVEKKGVEGNPYTVAEAIAYIGTLGTSTSASEVYVSGIISQVDSYNSKYSSIQYWISDDGTTTNQMEVYSGKGLNGANFSSADDLQVGDIVTVKGNVKMYNSTPEFTQNNQLVSFYRKPVAPAAPTFSPEAGAVVAGTTVTISATDGAVIYYTIDGTDPTTESNVYSEAIEITEAVTLKAIAVKDELTSEVATAEYTINVEPTIALSTTSVEATAAGADGTITVTYNNFTGVIAEVQFVEEDGTTSATYNWVTAEINEQTNNVDYVIGENTSAEDRTAYMKVYAVGNEGEAYSDLITITQAAYVIDYAMLPFYWAGGTKSDFLDLNGVTANGLGTDYAANNAPYRIKLDSDGDYIQIKTDCQPVLVSVDVKMIGGGSTSTITIQESTDGETFTDVEVLTIKGEQNTFLYLQTANAFDADTRYVRLYFTKGSNVGVGGITIEKDNEVATVGEAGYATYVTKRNVSFPEGVTAYIVTSIESTYVQMEEVASAPKGTPVILKGEGTHQLAPAASTADVNGNQLKVSDGTVKSDGTIYALANKTDGVGFYRVKEDITVPAGKAYLTVDAEPTGNVREFLAFAEGETDGIRSIDNGQWTMDNAVYSLSGQRVQKAQKGIYIVNGKKIMVK